MFVTPAIFLSGLLGVWVLIALSGRPHPALSQYSWRNLLRPMLWAALGPTVWWASPFGPGRTIADHLQSIAAYPIWLIASIVWLAPGIVLARRLAVTPVWVLPSLAGLTEVLIGAIRHWPPTQWWPVIFTGGIPKPSGYVLGFPVEAWYGYIYSIWSITFTAMIAALSFLVALRYVRPNNRMERAREP
jgi:hypothetical protein